MKITRTRTAVAGVLVLATVGLSVVLARTTPELGYFAQAAQAEAAAAQLRSAEDLSAAFQFVAEVATPSVVNISSVRRTRQAPIPDFFGERFFGERFPFPRSPGGDSIQQGLGTGVIVSDDGYILTNNHVVDGAEEVTVRLSDDRSFTAEVIGSDSKTDLAVLKIDATGLHPAALGDSEALRIGEWVVAVGNPFGLSSTITTGIVSAKGRANVGIADYEDYIQTDAAINPGNSGGPLLNLRGQVVGINTAIFSRSGGYMGIGFAIPINMARSIMESLIQDGRVVRGWLGVSIQNLDPGLAESFGFEGTDGVLVGDVTPNTPADEAGMKPGDIIVRFDGKRADNMSRLRTLVAETKPGTTVDVEVFRSSRKRTLRVTVGELEADLGSDATQRAQLNVGLRVRNLTPEIARQLGLDETFRGVVVVGVEPLSAAARAGIRPQDVIVNVQGTDVTTVEEFRREMKRHDLEKGVRLTIRNGATQRFAFVKLPD